MVEEAGKQKTLEGGPSSIQQRLERERDHLLRRLAEIQQALDLLKQRPELETLHRLLRGSLY